jgi:hypothetical protein
MGAQTFRLLKCYLRSGSISNPCRLRSRGSLLHFASCSKEQDTVSLRPHFIASFFPLEIETMTDEQRRSHAISQLRATRELYSETGDSIYLAVIDAHLHTIAEVDERRRLAQERRNALLQDLKAREDELQPQEQEKQRVRLKFEF